MRLDAVTVALRPRSSWEAVELGTALVRRHAGAVWRPWCAVTLPAFVVANAVGVLAGMPIVAMLLMWWLKPLFDRLPLFVLSRAVFGDMPDTRTTLRGAFARSGRALAAQLLWRRLSPARSLLMPVDMLEGAGAAQARARRRVLGGPAYGIASLCFAVFAAFESALVLGLVALLVLFVPDEYIKASLESLWRAVRDAPAWLQVAENAVLWIATSLLEPFYVGTGFGLYLNRRTEIEGWDIELVFRRLRARLQAAAGAALVLAVLAIAPIAQSAPAAPASGDRIPAGFGPEYRDPAAFERAAGRAFAGPQLHPKRRVTAWEPRDPKPDRKPGDAPKWLEAVAAAAGLVGKFGLWAIAGVVVLLLAVTARRWWPWLRGLSMPPPRAPSDASERSLPVEVPLPDDIVAAARRLWAAGQGREALALVYRASVEAMLAATGRVLPPGATEAQCLRAAQALPDEPRRAFAAVVRQWQYAAWAKRLPAASDFDDVLDTAALQFGWRA
ncbi:DUF4129 domain-containing protein [Lysobacter xanthus]